MQYGKGNFDIQAIDIQSLTWAQRVDLNERLIERAHMERTWAIRRMFGRLKQLMTGVGKANEENPSAMTGVVSAFLGRGE